MGLDPVTIMAGLALVTSVASSMNKPKMSLPQEPQSAKVPDANVDIVKNMGAGQAGGSPGVASTFLTGPGGIDPSMLKLGKNTLLGQ